jgi:hypothetical protein
VQEVGRNKVKILWNFRARVQARDLLSGSDAFFIEDGALHHPGTEPRTALFPLTWRKYTLEGEVELAPGKPGFVGFLFHHQGPGQFFLFALRDGRSTYQAKAGLYQSVSSARGEVLVSAVHEVDLADFDFEASHTLKLLVDGDSFRGLADNKMVFSQSIPRFGEGSIGIRADRPAVFTNVSVVGLLGDE